MPVDTPIASVLELTAQIVSAHVSSNTVAPDALPLLIEGVYKTLAGVGKEPVQPGTAAACRVDTEVGMP